LSDIAAAKAKFLAAVEGYASGQSARFAPAVDELIRWSEEHGLEFRPTTGIQTLLRYEVGGRIFWSVVARTGDGAKLTLLNDRDFPEPLRDAARTELARLDRKAEKEDGVPEVALTNLIWEPYRAQVLATMTRLLDAIKAASGESIPERSDT
jgi:hypothetical protein